jgi:tetratricopeptide (TPR) repeat protein
VFNHRGSLYDDRGNAYFSLKQNSKANSDFSKAISDYTEAIRLKPDLALAYEFRAIAYLSLKQYSKAISDYTEAIRLQPDNALDYWFRGCDHQDGPNDS